jgi:hypothetical protein
MSARALSADKPLKSSLNPAASYRRWSRCFTFASQAPATSKSADIGRNIAVASMDYPCVIVHVERSHR